MVKKIICIIIGTIFIISGIGKIGNVAEFGNLIAQYGFGYLRITAPIIVLAEIALGASLLLYIKPKIMGVCSFLLITIFTIAFSYGHFKHGINDCGCFGVLKIGQNNVVLVYIRNIILLGLSLFIWISGKKDSEEIQSWKNMLLLGILLPMIFIAGYTSRVPLFYKQEPHIFNNRHIKETALSEYIKTTSDSTYLLMWFSYTCSHCLNSIENFNQYKESGKVDRLVAFALVGLDSAKNAKDRNAFIDKFGNEIVTAEIINDYAIQSFIRAVPSSFFITNDTITTIIEGELHPF
jgi:uncharacterized membrane protein YphA (DoxX/SURF4 family)